MDRSEALKKVGQYLVALEQEGIPVAFGVLFGSYAKGSWHVDSDIDVVVVSPLFDTKRDRHLQKILWRVAADIDPRIEPIPCGQVEWSSPDGTRPILDSIQWEGDYVRLDAAA